MTRQSQRPRRDIFTEFPATGRAGLIVRYAGDGAERLAHSFADAAERLASTFRGQAPDDALLMPFLFLYRHAIELDLKHAIRFAARLRRNNGEPEESLFPEAVAERLQKKHGHRLMALVDELDAHLTKLNLPTLPKEVRRLLTLIQVSDPSGESFRYGSGLPNSQDQIDFPTLATALKKAYDIFSATSTMLDAYQDDQSVMLEEQRGLEVEHAAGMAEEQRAAEAEYAADLRDEFGSWG